MSSPRLSLELPTEVLEDIARRGAERALAENRDGRLEPYLDPDGAAEYLACPRSRIYDLVSQGRLRPKRDGRRLLFRREWLDDALEDGPAEP